MKKIHTYEEFVKIKEILPKDFMEEIEAHLLHLLEQEGIEEEQSIRLSSRKAIILIEENDELLKIVGELIDIEYIEKSTAADNTTYYRIAKRYDHEYQLLYTLAGVHDDQTEEWLKKYSE
ncbi:hypothetical protein [Bacillus sp. Au-Bac7]|uniref:hypothetical protein n=1 Tax=Bacillus sp. Au-Bac7 TaxID=2906458 RepID=UPI001E365B5C|nr:hypothetical protein [Bacillus sp. Au-Bac7]MCE4049919.1 hypothetical protein [Bacillus sp. Au-Bac7]